MIEAYAIGVAAKLEDGVTPVILRMIDAFKEVNGFVLEFTESLRILSSSGASLSRNLAASASAATKLGDSPGLTAATARLDRMAIASADIAKNLEAARAAGASVSGGGVIPPRQSGGGSGGGNSEGSVSSHVGSSAALVAAGTVGYGIYENAKLEDLNMMAVVNMQKSQSEWASTAEKLRKREFEFAHQFAGATHGEIKPFAEAEVVASRLLRTMPEMKQDEVMRAAMPYIALEAKQKGVPLSESTESFIGLAHQAGAYNVDKMKPLFEAMVQASLTTDMSLPAIAKAASYVVPGLRSAGADPTQILTLLATMQQAGITNSKAGTWINAMASNALPNTLGSGLFSNQKQNEALHKLGLYKGNKAQFYTDDKMDLVKQTQILAEDRLKMKPVDFNALLKMAFGTQGQRAAALFSEDSTQANMAALMDLTKKAQDPTLIQNMMRDMNTVTKADQVIANANMTLMNATATFRGPVNWMLNNASGAFDKTEKFTDQHPALGAAGIGAGVFSTVVGGMVLGKLAGKGADKIVSLAARGISSALALAMEGIPAAIIAMGGSFIVLSSACALALSGVMGYVIGTVLGKGIDTAIQSIPGHENETLGTWLYNSTHEKGVDAAHPSWKMPGQLPPAPVPPKPTDPVHQVNQDTLRKMHESAAKAAAGDGNNQATTVNVHTYIDGKEIANTMIPQTTRGPAGFNTAANIPRPSMGSLAFV